MSDCPGHEPIECSACLVRQALRDQFAMAALTGLIAWNGPDIEGGESETVVPDAYAYADAMLKEREK